MVTCNQFVNYEHKFWFIFFRQVAPDNNNVLTAVDTLPANTRSRNIRKVQINAKLTFGIWVVETLSMVALGLSSVILRMHKISNTLLPILFYVLLPYILLVNTSANKEHWVDSDFLNMIRNTVCLKRNGERIQPSDQDVEKCNKDTTLDDEKKDHSNHSRHNSSYDLSTSITCRRKPGLLKEDKKKVSCDRSPEIYTISNGEDAIDRRHSGEPPLIRSGNECIATTSSGKLPRLRDAESRNFMAKTLSSDSDTPIPQIKSYLQLAKTILDLMVDSIMVEEKYIYYFEELLRLNEERGEGCDNHLPRFEVNSFDDRLEAETKNGALRRCRIQQVINYEGLMTSPIQKNIYSEIEENTKNYHGNVTERILLRKNQLKNFAKNCKNESDYATFFNALIDLEEALVKSNY